MSPVLSSRRAAAFGVLALVATGLAASVVAAPGASAGVTTTTYDRPGTYTYTVPGDITSITVELVGGNGGSSPDPDDNPATDDAQPGGAGADLTAQLTVTPGQQLTLTVGGNGKDAGAAALHKGGANGGGESPYYGGGGGGASDLRIGGTTPADRVLVAAGGGGASQPGADGADGPASSAGGAADAAGANGMVNNCNPGKSSAAQPGTQVAGGTGGKACGGLQNGGDGVLADGGDGGDAAWLGTSGGGGGGGYYGGGGGNPYGGGAGGSSYVSSSDLVTGSVLGLAPAGTGHPRVVISVARASQEVAFTSEPPVSPAIGTSYTVTATGGSTGNPVVFSRPAGARYTCTVTNHGDDTASVRFTGGGTCAVSADQEGAPGVDAGHAVQSVKVPFLPQEIRFPQPKAMKAGGPVQRLRAHASSGLEVHYWTLSVRICQLHHGKVIPVSEGTCVIKVKQAGNHQYAAATPVTRDFRIRP